MPGVHPIHSLQSSNSAQETRSAMSFPSEVAHAAYDWWIEFLDNEETRVAAMCRTCRDIRTELASIVISQLQKDK